MAWEDQAAAPKTAFPRFEGDFRSVFDPAINRRLRRQAARDARRAGAVAEASLGQKSPGAAAALDTGGNPSTPPFQAPLPGELRGRARSWALSDGLRRILLDRGIRNSITGCGTAAKRRGAAAAMDDGGDPEVTFREEHGAKGERAIGVDGVVWCGSFRCPRCGPLRGRQLTHRISVLFKAAREKGFNVALVTLTASHGPQTRLSEMRSALSSARSRMPNGGLLRRLTREGLVGWTGTWETTAGRVTGWHLHSHLLVIHEGSEEATLEAGRELTGRWLHLLHARGWRALPTGQDVRIVRPEDADQVAAYEAKQTGGWGIAAEAAGQWHKGGRTPSRLSLPELLAVASAGGPDAAWAADRYAEAVEALKGLAILTLGAALKKRLGITADDLTEDTDLELVEQEGTVLGSLPGRVWTRAASRRLRGWVLAEIERLTGHGVCWEDVEETVTQRVMAPVLRKRPPAPDG
ncbi:hypothetical protein E2C06_33490 [Dankookia rubra]|uniref:Replication protein n=1 Tax=Dankookia rubra TaxID=1442381 RepID=A0A4R5Q6T7_9PROT|nr:hypothetical protein [Dankookia rubra]TDH58263.1 hypothetical protein E2C06_33490 [Dankookia rubra]